jgi:mono/diheme cytochrome c family protein
MGEAVDLSLSQLTSSDLSAIATYLRSTKPIRSAALPAAAGAAADSPKVASVQNADGKRIFEGNCVSCHAWSGAGAIIGEAQLTGVRAINDVSAANVVQMILTGTESVKTGRPYMPGFAEIYSNADIAAVANYVTGRFGSVESSATPQQVAMLRLQH